MDQPLHRSGAISRRAVLLGGAGTVLLAACGTGGSTASTTSVRPSPSLLAFFPPNDYLSAGVSHRLAFGVGSGVSGAPDLDGPRTLALHIEDPAGSTTEVEAIAHDEGLPWSYYRLDYTPPVEGTYTTTTTVDGLEAYASFMVIPEGTSKVPDPGTAMPALVTPTVADARGIDPLCTNTEPCPFHEVSLDAALELDKPTVYLVSTPKFCQIGICGPVLDILGDVAGRPAYADTVTFIHQEVYQHADEAAEKGANATLADAVRELALPSEPVLFVIGRDGTVAARLDAAYDAVELTGTLDTLL